MRFSLLCLCLIREASLISKSLSCLLVSFLLLFVVAWSKPVQWLLYIPPLEFVSDVSRKRITQE